MIKFTDAEPAKPKQAAAPKPDGEDAKKAAATAGESAAGAAPKIAAKRKKSERA
jgi:hypothetical protein